MAKLSALSRVICEVCEYALVCLTRPPRQVVHTMHMFDDQGGVFHCNGYPSGARVEINMMWAELDDVIDKLMCMKKLKGQEARDELQRQFKNFQPWGGQQ